VILSRRAVLSCRLVAEGTGRTAGCGAAGHGRHCEEEALRSKPLDTQSCLHDITCQACQA